MIRFASCCSGIEAASVAWPFWQAAWFSEIEPFPCVVLKHHYPDVPNYGDMTALPERILSGEIEAPDVFCGGTPCQAFSVAGNRQSLDDARGNLSLTFCEIANAIDSARSVRGSRPAIIFWENVPGVLNTDDNAFGCFLGKLAGEHSELQPPGGRWADAGVVHGPVRAIAWRVLDAQFFGLAQRRRRVFVVASSREGFNPAEVLFEFDGVRRDTPPSREARQGAAADAAGGAGGKWWDGGDTAGTLTVEGAGGNQRMPDKGNLGAVMVPVCAVGGDIAHTLRAEGFDASEDGTGRGQPIVAIEATGHDQQVAVPVIGWYEVKCNHCGERFDTKTGLPLVCEWCGYKNELVAFHAEAQSDQLPPAEKDTSVSDALTCSQHAAVATQYAVRRLTPTECERLQGFPDGYTNIPWRNKSEAPDGPRYKALGNSWAVAVVRWIGERINDAVA